MTKPISLVEVGAFLRQASAILDEDELEDMKWHLATDPTAGVVIPGTGGVRKLRWASSGRGKSGGSRVIYFFHNDTMPVFLLAAYPKNAKADLTEKEKAQMRRIVSLVVAQHKPKQEQ